MVQHSALPHVAARRVARQKILELLEGMELEDRRFVVEEILQDINDEEAGDATPAPARRVKRPDSVPRRPLAPKRASGEGPRPARRPPLLVSTLADRIFEYCRAHPSHDGTYSMQFIAKRVSPGVNPAQVHTAVKRNSPQSDRDPKPENPRFTWLRRGTFKLYEPGDEKKQETGS